MNVVINKELERLILGYGGHAEVIARLSSGPELRKTSVSQPATTIHKTTNTEHMENVRIILPQERLTAVDMRIDGKPYVGVLNEGLLDFSHKDVFGWYLSLIIDYEKTVGDGMPGRDDTSRMQTFSDMLTKGLSGNPEHPNLLFLGRVTGDGYSQIMWYVNNPDTADKYLKKLIDSNNYPFDFDYEMTSDPEWSEADYWLKPLATK